MTSADVVGSLIPGIISHRFSAKQMICTFASISSFTLLLMMIFVDKDDHDNWVTPIFFAFGRLGVCMTFTTLFLKHPSMFPTIFIVTSMGIANFTARLFVIGAPIVAEMAYPDPVAIVFVLQLICAITALFLKQGTSDLGKKSGLPNRNDRSRNV